MEGFHINLLAFTTILLSIISLNPCLAAALSQQCPSYLDYVRASCGVTKYPNLCYNSISSYLAKIHASKKALPHAALSITLSDIVLASEKLHKLAKIQALHAEEVDALHDCIKKLKEAKENIKKCIKEIRSRSASFEIRVLNVKKWLDIAMDEVKGCGDVIVGKILQGVVKAMAGHHIFHVIQVTSVTVELLDTYANKHD